MSAAVARNAGGSLRVRVDDTGVLLAVHIDRDEMRYGGASLSAAILELYERARADAVDRRRAELLRDRVPPEVVDRTHPAVDRATPNPVPSAPSSRMRRP